jgi:hypothetical protein
MQKTISDLLHSKFVDDIGGETILAFNGAISQDAIVGFGEILRSELHFRNPLSIVNRAFAIFIEMTQNLLHYSSERVENNGMSVGVGSVLLLKASIGYYIITSNIISEKQKQFLEKKCNLVNSLNKEDLKEFYLKKRREVAETDSKGAGLGFIDIVRRSGTPVEFLFEPMGQGKFIFYLGSKILTE